MLWEVLAEFVFRLSFGVAVSMAWTPATMVASGYYKVHLWVLLGLNTFAALAVANGNLGIDWLLSCAIIAAIASYLGSVIWMYEAKRLGLFVLYGVALTDLVGALLITCQTDGLTQTLGGMADVVTSGMLLGLTMTAMLLGHWYLNSPGMKLQPLKQLILLLMAFVFLRSLLCGGGLVAHIRWGTDLSTGWFGLVALRWLSGLVGIAVLSWMTWQTLKIPNTQSATGILYVAVIFSFLGELSSQLLAAGTPFPL